MWLLLFLTVAWWLFGEVKRIHNQFAIMFWFQNMVQYKSGGLRDFLTYSYCGQGKNLKLNCLQN